MKYIARSASVKGGRGGVAGAVLQEAKLSGRQVFIIFTITLPNQQSNITPCQEYHVCHIPPLNHFEYLTVILII